MRLRDLEITLERSVPPFPAPRAELEQYRTPARVAADALFQAYALGDVAGRRVVDLGCGTGMLSVGAALLGAADVLGVDVDAHALEAARRAAAAAEVEVRFEAADVAEVEGEADTVLTNPPFGAQVPGADRPFLAAALRSAPVVYAFHNAGTEAFVDRFARELGAEPTHRWAYAFEIPHVYRHHTKARQVVPVAWVRLERIRPNK